MIRNLNMSGRGVMLVSVLVAVVLLVCVGTAAAQSAPDCSTVTYEGDGTTSNPYEVGDVNQLRCIESQGLNSSYEVVSDIDASDTSSWDGGKGFDPVGEFSSFGTPFTGRFDGNGFNITNVTIDRGGEYHVGVFGTVSGGTVTNVSIVGVDTEGFGNVGGLVGVNFYGTVTDSDVTGSVNGIAEVGGLVGDNYGTVSHSHAAATVGGTRDVGGLVGENVVGAVERSHVSGLVQGTGSEEGLVNGVGGLVGRNFVAATVDESYASGSVDGSGDVGGLVAFNEGAIERSYAASSVNGGTDFMGGLVGLHTGTVSESYAVGPVNGSHNFVGGLVGNIVGGGTVSGSYWNKETTGQPSSAGGTGLTTSEMIGSAAPENMVGFDFGTAWRKVVEPDGYPVLRWESEGDDRS